MALSPQLVGGVQVVAGVVSLASLKPAVDNPDKPGRAGYGLFAVGVALWMFGLGVPNFAASRVLSTVGVNVLLLGTELTAAGWLLLALSVTGRGVRLQRTAVLLGAGVLVLQLGFWTNPLHHVMYRVATGPAVPRGAVINGTERITFATGFWVHAAACYAVALVAEATLVVEGVRSTGVRREQLLLLSAVAVPILAASVVSTLDPFAVPYNVSSVGYLAGTVVLWVVLFRTGFLDVTPVARRTAIAEMDDALVVLDDENRVVNANRRARELFDAESSSVGATASEFFEPLRDDVVTQFTAPGETDAEVEIELDGEDRHFSVSVTPLGDRTRRGRVVLLHDITTQKRRERELQRQRDRVDEFAAVVSHDLRNPLNVADGYVQMARETGDVEHLDAVSDAHDRMDEIVEGLLTMARAETVVDDPPVVALEPVVTEAWATVPAGGSTLETLLDGAEIAGNPELLRSVLENLFRNAVEHGSTSPDSQARQDAVDHNDQPVTVTVGVLSDAEGFYVADDGAGVPPGEREDIFEYGHSTADGGTGLGLAIVTDLVEAHGWSIAVSESESDGARFEVTGVELDP
ncbi:MAG: histidine kinase N-terminal 7TM domain-containing protein [Halobacterium sp.]